MMKLKGKNQIVKFKKVAESLVSKISLCKGVSGIVFVGGLVRGFVDEFSDLDVYVLTNKDDEALRNQIHEIYSSEEKSSGIEIDLELHLLEDFKKRRWNEIERWEFSKANIAYDLEGEIKKIFMKKLSLAPDFWIKRIASCVEYMRWYCCPSEKDIKSIAEMWLVRGKLLDAHYCLNYGVELLLKTIFALNKEFLPPPKWKLFYSYEQKWMPKDYKELMEEAIGVNNSSTESFRQRLGAIQKIWRNMTPKIEDQIGLTLDKIREYYVEKILCQKIHHTLNK